MDMPSKEFALAGTLEELKIKGQLVVHGAHEVLGLVGVDRAVHGGTIRGEGDRALRDHQGHHRGQGTYPAKRQPGWHRCGGPGHPAAPAGGEWQRPGLGTSGAAGQNGCPAPVPAGGRSEI